MGKALLYIVQVLLDVAMAPWFSRLRKKTVADFIAQLELSSSDYDKLCAHIRKASCAGDGPSFDSRCNQHFRYAFCKHSLQQKWSTFVSFSAKTDQALQKLHASASTAIRIRWPVLGGAQ